MASRWATKPPSPRAFFIAAVAGWFLAWLLKLALPVWQETLAYPIRPDFFCQRLGWILLVAGLCQLLPRPEKWRPLLFAGQHSLLLYVLHLQLIHGGMGFLPSLKEHLGKSQSPEQVLLLFAEVLAASLLLTWFISWVMARLPWRKVTPTAS